MENVFIAIGVGLFLLWMGIHQRRLRKYENYCMQMYRKEIIEAEFERRKTDPHWVTYFERAQNLGKQRFISPLQTMLQKNEKLAYERLYSATGIPPHLINSDCSSDSEKEAETAFFNSALGLVEPFKEAGEKLSKLEKKYSRNVGNEK